MDINPHLIDVTKGCLIKIHTHMFELEVGRDGHSPSKHLDNIRQPFIRILTTP